MTDKVAIYQAADGKTSLEVHLEQETVWLSQAQMVDLFERDVSVVSRHIRNVFKEGELAQKSNLQKMQIANSDRPVAFYSLDVIISVGYRVKSQRGTQFRQWAPGCCASIWCRATPSTSSAWKSRPICGRLWN